MIQYFALFAVTLAAPYHIRIARQSPCITTPAPCTTISTTIPPCTTTPIPTTIPPCPTTTTTTLPPCPTTTTTTLPPCPTTTTSTTTTSTTTTTTTTTTTPTTTTTTTPTTTTTTTLPPCPTTVATTLPPCTTPTTTTLPPCPTPTTTTLAPCPSPTTTTSSPCPSPTTTTLAPCPSPTTTTSSPCPTPTTVSPCMMGFDDENAMIHRREINHPIAHDDKDGNVDAIKMVDVSSFCNRKSVLVASLSVADSMDRSQIILMLRNTGDRTICDAAISVGAYTRMQTSQLLALSDNLYQLPHSIKLTAGASYRINAHVDTIPMHVCVLAERFCDDDDENVVWHGESKSGLLVYTATRIRKTLLGEINFDQIEIFITNVSPQSICDIKLSINDAPNGHSNIDQDSGLEYIDGSMFKVKDIDALSHAQSITVRINVYGALPLIELDSEQVC